MIVAKSTSQGEKIELVGGPLCGCTVRWPSADPLQDISVYDITAPYVLVRVEDKNSIPVVRGWYEPYMRNTV